MAVSSLASNFIGASDTNFSYGREAGISRITIHHMAGVMSSIDCGRIFQTPNRQASAHYGIGVNGDVAAYVDEANTCWSDANWYSNCRTISIETSNSSVGGDWPVSDASFDTLVRLVADIAQRNGLGNLQVGVNLFKHNDFIATTCPGPYLQARMQEIADKANAIINGGTPAPSPSPAPAPSGGKSIDELANEVIAGYWGNGADRQRNLANAGYDYNAVQARVNEILYGGGSPSAPTYNSNLDDIAKAVIRGDYGNGDNRIRNLQAAGYDYNAIQARVNEILGGAPVSNTTTAGNAITVGSSVVPVSWVDYNGTPLAQTRSSYTVSEISGDRAVLTSDGAVYAAVNTANLRLA